MHMQSEGRARGGHRMSILMEFDQSGVQFNVKHDENPGGSNTICKLNPVRFSCIMQYFGMKPIIRSHLVIEHLPGQ
jgi:hypothetical protein